MREIPSLSLLLDLSVVYAFCVFKIACEGEAAQSLIPRWLFWRGLRAALPVGDLALGLPGSEAVQTSRLNREA